MARKSGSATARGGFQNEALIVAAFNKGGTFATNCLSFMGFTNCSGVKAVHVPHKLGSDSAMQLLGLPSAPTVTELESITKQQKADIRLLITHDSQSSCVNLSLKKSNAKANFNQVDKRSVDTYQKQWGFDSEIRRWLRIFTGAASAAEFAQHTKGLTIDSRRKRVKFTNLPDGARKKILAFLETNKRRIVADVLQGSGQLAADYVMVTEHADKSIRVHLCQIAKVVAFVASDAVSETSRGNIQFGKLTIQRYGGTPYPTLLQFKIKPGDLFNVPGQTFRVKITQAGQS